MQGFLLDVQVTASGSPDNSNIRMPFYELDQGRRLESLFTSFAQTTSPISMNPMVDTSNRIAETGFAFIEDVHTIRVAVWPHDPLGRLKTRLYFEIVDKNQEEQL